MKNLREYAYDLRGGTKTCFYKGEYLTLRNLFSQGWVHHFAKLFLTRVRTPLRENKLTCISYRVERIVVCYNRRGYRRLVLGAP